jgi:hypothetical protein
MIPKLRSGRGTYEDGGLMATKRQQTMAKITRERAVKEKRERKLEKKRAAAAERRAKADGTWVEPEVELDAAEDEPAQVA